MVQRLEATEEQERRFSKPVESLLKLYSGGNEEIEKALRQVALDAPTKKALFKALVEMAPARAIEVEMLYYHNRKGVDFDNKTQNAAFKIAEEKGYSAAAQYLADHAKPVKISTLVSKDTGLFPKEENTKERYSKGDILWQSGLLKSSAEELRISFSIYDTGKPSDFIFATNNLIKFVGLDPKGIALIPSEETQLKVKGLVYKAREAFRNNDFDYGVKFLTAATEAAHDAYQSSQKIAKR